MAMRHNKPKVVNMVVKGLKEDVVTGGKWLWDKVSSDFKERFSFDDNSNNLPQLTKTRIMSPTDIPDLGGTVEDESDDEFEDEAVMDTVSNLSEGSPELQIAETTGELLSAENIVHLQGVTVEDAPCLQNEAVGEASKDVVGSKVSTLSEGAEISHEETHISGDEYVAEHVYNSDNTIAKPEDYPVYYYSSPANTQKAVPVLEPVGLSPIEPICCQAPPLPKFNDFNSMGGNILFRNSSLDPTSIPRIEEDEFIPNAVVHEGSKLYEASSGVWVAEPIVSKPLFIDKI